MLHEDHCLGFLIPKTLKRNIGVLSPLLTQTLITVMKLYMCIKEREEGIKLSGLIRTNNDHR